MPDRNVPLSHTRLWRWRIPPQVLDIALKFRDALVKFIADDCPTQAAAIAFYTLFSLPALLVISVTIASLMFDPDDVRGRVATEIRTVVGVEGGRQIRTMIEHAYQPGEGPLGIWVGAAVLLFGASGVVGQLQATLNRIWHVKVDYHQNFIKSLLLKRLFSVAMVLGVGFLLLVSLLINAVISAAGARLMAFFPPGLSETALLFAHWGVSLALIALLFAAMFRFLPDARITWRSVGFGGLVTALLFMLGNALISWYFAAQNLGSVYGAAGSLTMILIWVYYSTMILLLGAELTNVIGTVPGKEPEPEEGATRDE